MVVQMFLALGSGGRLVLVSEVVKMMPEVLCEVLVDRQCVTLFQVIVLLKGWSMTREEKFLVTFEIG